MSDDGRKGDHVGVMFHSGSVMIITSKVTGPILTSSCISQSPRLEG